MYQLVFDNITLMHIGKYKIQNDEKKHWSKIHRCERKVEAAISYPVQSSQHIDDNKAPIWQGRGGVLFVSTWLASFILPLEEPRNIIQRCANSPRGLGGRMNPGTRRVLRIIPKFYQMSIGVSAEGFLWAQRIDNSFISTPLSFCVFSHLSQCTVQIKTLVQQLVSKCKTFREFVNKSLSALDNRCHVHF